MTEDRSTAATFPSITDVAAATERAFQVGMSFPSLNECMDATEEFAGQYFFQVNGFSFIFSYTYQNVVIANPTHIS